MSTERQIVRTIGATQLSNAQVALLAASESTTRGYSIDLVLQRATVFKEWLDAKED